MVCQVRVSESDQSQLSETRVRSGSVKVRSGSGHGLVISVSFRVSSGHRLSGSGQGLVRIRSVRPGLGHGLIRSGSGQDEV